MSLFSKKKTTGEHIMEFGEELLGALKKEGARVLAGIVIGAVLKKGFKIKNK